MIKAILKLTIGIILGLISFSLTITFGVLIYSALQSSTPGVIIFCCIVILIAGVCLWGAVKSLKSFSNYINSKYPVATHENGKKYAGFSRRFKASLIDFLILAPILFLPYVFTYTSKAMFLIIIGLTSALVYYVYVVGFEGYNGQTIGKKIAKVKITGINGSRAGYLKAIKRSSVNILSSLIYFVIVLFGVKSLSTSDFANTSYTKALQLIHDGNKSFSWHSIFINLWMISEFFVLNFNTKRRALHDYIAGTVVLESD